MKEKIFEALKTKFKEFGVPASILEGVADKLSKTVTTEDQIETAVSGVNFETLSQSEIDRRTIGVVEKAIENYEKKHGLKDGKPVENPESKKKPDAKSKPNKDEGGDDGDEPEWAKKLSERLESYEEKITRLEKERETSSKLSQAKDLLKASKIPDKLKDKWLKRVNVDDEDTSLEDQVKALEDEYLELKQEHINESVKEGGETQGGETTSADMEEFLNEKFPEGAEAE